MSAASSPAALAAAWPQVLEEVQAALGQAEAEAALREQALPPAAPVPALEELPPVDPAHRRRVAERRKAWENRLQEAEQVARETDVALRETEEALRRWLQEAGPPGQQVEEWTPRAA